MRFQFRAALFTALLVLGCSPAYALGTGEGGLAAALKQHYKLASPRLNVHGVSSMNPGTVLVVQKDGIVAFEDADSSYARLCPSEFRGGRIHTPGSLACTSLAPKSKRFLKVSEPVCVTAIDVSEMSDAVTFYLATCDPRHRQGFRSYRAEVVFRLSKGSVAQSSPLKIEQTIGRVLAEQVPEDRTASPAQAAKTGKPAGTAPPAATPPPAATSQETATSPEADSAGHHAALQPATKQSATKQPADVPGSAADADTPGTANPQTSDPETSEPPQPDPTVAGIAKHQTTDQVQSILGPPDSIADLGAKTLYVYPHLKVVFVDGKVSEIQQF